MGLRSIGRATGCFRRGAFFCRLAAYLGFASKCETTGSGLLVHDPDSQPARQMAFH